MDKTGIRFKFSKRVNPFLTRDNFLFSQKHKKMESVATTPSPKNLPISPFPAVPAKILARVKSSTFSPTRCRTRNARRFHRLLFLHVLVTRGDIPSRSRPKSVPGANCEEQGCSETPDTSTTCRSLVADMNERSGGQPSNEDGLARVPGRPKVDVFSAHAASATGLRER